MIGEEVPAGLRVLETLSPQPALALVSGRIYPSPAADLIRELRRLAPDLVAVVLASAHEGQLPVRPLMDDRVRHLAVTDPLTEPDHAYKALCTLLRGTPWELATYLKSVASVIEVTNVSPSGKEAALGRIEALLAGQDEDLDLLRQRAVLLADEMLENAFLISKSENREVPGQVTSITLRAGFDGESLALQVVDHQGSLFPEDALAFLAQHQDGSVPLDQLHGRGLFIIWRFLDHFHVNIRPGLETAIGGQLKRSSSLVTDLPKGFHFFIQPPSCRLDLSPPI
jgi:anti-sigma regulatory factor (Ser/Thr protein kinase)